MALYHVYNQTVADGTATSVVRPSDWNSAHSQVMTLAGNTVGASTVSGTNIVYQGGNNVTLSANQAASVATVVISAANQTVQTQASGNIVGSGFTSATTAGTAVVATQNSNGLSMGVPAYITTYVAQTTQTQPAGNIAGAGFTSTTTAGANIVATQNSNGLSMGVPAYITTYAAQTTQTQNLHNVTLSGNTAGVMAQISSGTMTLAGGNNITLSQNGNAVTISGPNVSQYLTTARASNDAVGLNTALTANGVSWTVNSSGISMNVPAFLTTAAQSNHSHNFATTTTNGSQIVVGTANSAGATVGVPPFITTYVAQTTQTQPAGNIAGVGTTFGGTNVSATMGFNSNGLALSLSAPTPGGGGAINVSAGTTSGNLQTIQFNNANGVTFGLNGSTVTASVNTNQDFWSLQGNTAGTNVYTWTNDGLYLAGGNNITLSGNGSTITIVGAAGGGGATESNYFPHVNALWAPAQVGQNSIQVQPLANVPVVSYDRLGYAVQFSGATNSTMTVNCTVHMGVYSLNGSTLSQLTSGSGAFSINGSGTANSTINSGPRWATMTMNAGGSFSGDVWIAFKSSTATVGVNATLSNLVASRVNSSWSGFIGVGTANSVQSLPGMGYYSATSAAMPSSMALSHITGISSTAQRPQVFFMTNGALPT